MPFPDRFSGCLAGIARSPWLFVLPALLLIAGIATQIPRLKINASADAFLPTDDPVLQRQRKVEQVFGLGDSLLLLIVNDGPHGVFTPRTMALVAWFTDALSAIPGVDPDHITSLATENRISATDDGIAIAPFLEEIPATPEEAEKIQQAVNGFPLYLGSLVSRDGTSTAIVIEPIDTSLAPQTYQAVRDTIARAPVWQEQIHLAGESAVSSQLGYYINSDMGRLNLWCAIVITLVLLLSYRTWIGVFLPLLVVGGTNAVVLGLMGYFAQPFYVITNALPVILIAIGVADGVHILGQYYEEKNARPEANQTELVIKTMRVIWRPVTVTSLTDVAGFMGLFLSSEMPPMKAFGLFAAIGAATAWLLSVLVLPSVLVLLPKSTAGKNRLRDGFGLAMTGLGRQVQNHARLIVWGASILAVVFLAWAGSVEVNEERIRNFRPEEPIYQATQAVNNRLNGANHLDIVLETSQPEGWFHPDRLRRLEAMQEYVTSLPHVKAAVSIVDVLKQIHRVLHEDRPEDYRLPASEDLVAQYFLLHSAASNPTALQQLVDYNYQTANLQVTMNSGKYSDERDVVEAIQNYIDDHMANSGLNIYLTGRVNFDYHWIGRLGRNHFLSVAIALLAVWVSLIVSFRSISAGSMALLPVGLSVLSIYAVMGAAGIWLSIGTSMFAAIAIGTGVDFAVYVVDRTRTSLRQNHHSPERAIAEIYPSTGRALLFNFLAVFLGFGLLMTSHVPPLIIFGALITCCIGASFLWSLTVLPAIVKIFGPGIIGIHPKPPNQ